MTQGIYAITNKLNGKVYIGCSKNIKTRFNSHKALLKKGIHHSTKLQQEWDQYGKESFDFSIIQEVEDSESLLEVEQQFIKEYKAWQGYNGLAGRKHGSTKPDSLVWFNVTLGLPKETVEWYKSLPDGSKNQTMRDVIALYRQQSES